MINFKTIWEGLKIKAKAVLTSDEVGEIEVSSVDNKTYLHNGSTRSPIVTEAHTATLTNKTIDANGTGNSISNLETADLAAGVLNTSTTLAAASDTQVPSALAVKTYVDNGLAAQDQASEITYDNTTSGLAATNVQAAIDEVEGRLQTAETDISNHISDAVDAHDASAISFVPVGAVVATDVQSAIAEIDADLTAHIGDTIDAHDASAISVVPTGNLAASDAQSAFNELQSNVDALYNDQNATDTALNNHITDTVDAHDASAISSIPAGNLAATDVQSALNELQTDIDTRATQASLTDHITDLIDAHAASAIGFTPTGSLSSTDVQSAIAEVDSDLTAHINDTTPHSTISGSSIQDPTRLDVKKDTLSNLTTYAATATNGQIVFATDVKEMYQIVDNALVAVGSGGGTGIGVNQLSVQTFDDAIIGDFTQTGLELVTSSTIHGGQTARLIHQASSNYSFKQLIDVDRKFRGKSNTLSLTGYSTASSSNITVLVTDETNSATLLSSTFTTGQITAAVFNTASSTTVTVTNNSILNQLSVGARITGSGIPTGTTITAVNSSLGTITISNAATATATGVSLKVSALPNVQSYAFDIPTNCSSISYTVTALQEAGLPETYVDDIVIELTDIAMTSTSVTVPKNNNYSGVIQNGITIGATTTAPTKGTTAVDRIVHSRVENRLIAEYQYQQSSGGSAGSGDYLFTLPFGLSFDSSIVGFYTGASPNSTDISKAVVGYALPSDGSTISYTSALVAYDATRFRVLAMWGGSNKGFIGNPYFNMSIAQGYSLRLNAPIANWKTNETETKTIPLSSSVIVTEPDSMVEVSVANGYGSTNTVIRRFLNVDKSIGNDILYQDSPTLGGSFTVLTAGIYNITYLDNLNGLSNIGISLNSTQLTTDINSIPIANKLAQSVIGAAGYKVTASVSGVYLNVGDVIRAHTSGTAATINNDVQFIMTKVGSTKILNPSSDQKIQIPTHTLRFEGSNGKGSTDTGIVYFNSLSSIIGDGIDVVSNAVNGTVLTIKKAGLLSVRATITSATAGADQAITINQSNLTNIFPPASEILAYNEEANVNFYQTMTVSSYPVKVGDKIRVFCDNALNNNFTSGLSVTLQETSVAVALQNVAPRWDDSDSCVRLNTANGYGSVATRIRRFSNLNDNFGSSIEYTDSPTEGARFSIKEDGEYQVSYTESATGISTFGISLNSNNLAVNAGTLLNNANNEILAAATVPSASYMQTVSWQGFLRKGDIIRPHTDAIGISNPSNTKFSINKVGKTQGTVDVTPFVQIPQNEVEAIEALTTTSTFGSTNTGVPVLNITKNTNKGIIQVLSSAAEGTSFKILKDCELQISVAFQSSVANGSTGFITKNSTTLTATAPSGAVFQTVASSISVNNMSTNIIVSTGDVIRFQRDSTNLNNVNFVTITATAISPSIATPTEQVSSDTIPFVFKATAITDSDPVGTFNTYTYAANTNTATISATAPTQTTSSMNVNGVQVFARAYGSAGASTLPSRFDIKIGKGLKSKEVLAYVGAAKTNPVSFEHWTYGTTVELGAPVLYNEVTGVLTIESAVASSSSIASRFIGFDVNGTGQTSAYFVFNASKSPSLVSIPNLQQRVAYVDRVIASGTGGGTTTAGVWTVVPLTGLTDSSGLGISLAANTITIPAGTYKISAYQTLIGLDVNIRLRNTTLNTTAIVGSGAYPNNTSPAAITPVNLEGEINITSTQTFQLQYYAQSSYATYGLGGAATNMSENMKVANISITKIK